MKYRDAVANHSRAAKEIGFMKEFLEVGACLVYLWVVGYAFSWAIVNF